MTISKVWTDAPTHWPALLGSLGSAVASTIVAPLPSLDSGLQTTWRQTAATSGQRWSHALRWNSHHPGHDGRHEQPSGGALNLISLSLIFALPASDNVKWRDVEALLVSLGATLEKAEGSRITIRLGTGKRRN